MRTPLKITRRTTEATLMKASKSEDNPKVVKRILGILDIKRGETVPATARRCGLCERSMRNWVHKFNEFGLKGLYEKKRTGRNRKLSSNQEVRLANRIKQGPKKGDRQSAIRGKDLQRILKDEFGKSYSLPGVYVLLHRLGFSNLIPRPRNPRTNNIKQGIFKKNSTASDPEAN